MRSSARSAVSIKLRDDFQPVDLAERAAMAREGMLQLVVAHCRLPRVNIQASTLAAISGLRRRDTMPEMAVSGADPFRKRPD